MPFTFSHPAAILPFIPPAIRYGSVSALVIGSMVPDFSYFARVGNAALSHSAEGLLLFCLPVGLGLYFVFHAFMKRPLYALLPSRLAGTIPPAWVEGPLLPPVSLVAVSACLVFGAATHNALDACTHDSGAIVQRHPALAVDMFTIANYTVRPYRILQHGLSAAGLLLIAGFLYWQLRRRAAPSVEMLRLNAPQSIVWVLVITSPVCAAMLSAGMAWLSGARDPQPLAYAAVFGSLPVFTAVVCSYCLMWNVLNRFGWRRPAS